MLVTHPHPPQQLCIEQARSCPNAVRLALRGELDLAGAPALEERLREATAWDDDVIVDLRDLTFIDSTGLRVLVLAAGASDRVRFTRGGREVMRALELTGLAGRLNFVD